MPAITHIVRIRVTAVWSKLPHSHIDQYYVKEAALTPFEVITSWVDHTGGVADAAADAADLARNAELHLLDVEEELRRRLAWVASCKESTALPLALPSFSRIIFRHVHPQGTPLHVATNAATVGATAAGVKAEEAAEGAKAAADAVAAAAAPGVHALYGRDVAASAAAAVVTSAAAATAFEMGIGGGDFWPDTLEPADLMHNVLPSVKPQRLPSRTLQTFDFVALLVHDS